MRTASAVRRVIASTSRAATSSGATIQLPPIAATEGRPGTPRRWRCSRRPSARTARPGTGPATRAASRDHRSPRRGRASADRSRGRVPPSRRWPSPRRAGPEGRPPGSARRPGAEAGRDDEPRAGVERQVDLIRTDDRPRSDQHAAVAASARTAAAATGVRKVTSTTGRPPARSASATGSTVSSSANVATGITRFEQRSSRTPSALIARATHRRQG